HRHEIGYSARASGDHRNWGGPTMSRPPMRRAAAYVESDMKMTALPSTLYCMLRHRHFHSGPRAKRAEVSRFRTSTSSQKKVLQNLSRLGRTRISWIEPDASACRTAIRVPGGSVAGLY